MSINRMKLWLALGLQLLVTSMSAAQELKEDEWVPGVKDVRLFAPADLSYYGNGPRRPKGWWFTIEGLNWATSAPERTPVGNPDFHPLTFDGEGFAQQQNTQDTGYITPYMKQGERLQLGYVDDEGKGWMVGTIVLHTSTSQLTSSNAGVSFFAPFVNGVSPLEGFAESVLPIPPNQPAGFIGGGGGTGGGGGGTNNSLVVDADVNGNGIFGATGQDIGTPNANPPPFFVPPPDGFPDVPHATDFGDLVQLPIVFSHLTTKYSSRLWGIEVMRTWQLAKRKSGAWDLMAGVRYLRFRDNFYFSGTGEHTNVTLTPPPPALGDVYTGVLADTAFTQTADNNLVGPQIGLRYIKAKGRLSLSTEARFMAAANFQTNQQNGWIANRPNAALNRPNFVLLPHDNTIFRYGFVPSVTTPNLFNTGVHHTQHATQFSPVGELRFNLNYQVYRSLSVNVGWTGLVMGGMARSPNMVNYALPDMGILSAHNRQTVLIQGINFGASINR
ncbi:MAG TPA: BBP7 family outer membrane beta-barrel protein [Pirellulales bacterium]|nr:BBP7 family outer membrane beta-barrel protein [Pirellulales bacterium]